MTVATRGITTSFQSKPSARFTKAVEVLLDLYQNEGMDSLDRAYASVAKGAKLDAMRVAGYSLSQGTPCPCRVLARGGSCFADGLPSPDFNDPYLYDHPKVWNKDGMPELFTAEPYSLEVGSMPHLVDICQKFNLDGVVTARYSSHFPGHTLQIELRRKQGTSWSNSKAVHGNGCWFDGAPS